MILEILKFLGEFFSFVNKRTELKNANDVKEAQKRADEIAAVNKIEKTVCNKDVKQSQKDWAE